MEYSWDNIPQATMINLVGPCAGNVPHCEMLMEDIPDTEQ